MVRLLVVLVEIRKIGRRYHLSYVLEGHDPNGNNLKGRMVMAKTDTQPSLYDRLTVSWEHITHVLPDEGFPQS